MPTTVRCSADDHIHAAGRASAIAGLTARNGMVSGGDLHREASLAATHPRATCSHELRAAAASDAVRVCVAGCIALPTTTTERRARAAMPAAFKSERESLAMAERLIMTQKRGGMEIAPELYQAALELEKKLEALGLAKHYVALIKIRPSQINGCAFCINLHTREARRLGMGEWKIYLLPAWRESTCSMPRSARCWRGRMRSLASPSTARRASCMRSSRSTSVNVRSWRSTPPSALGFGMVHPAEKELSGAPGAVAAPR